jgi:hypothetical protein
MGDLLVSVHGSDSPQEPVFWNHSTKTAYSLFFYILLVYIEWLLSSLVSRCSLYGYHQQAVSALVDQNAPMMVQQDVECFFSFGDPITSKLSYF